MTVVGALAPSNPQRNASITGCTISRGCNRILSGRQLDPLRAATGSRQMMRKEESSYVNQDLATLRPRSIFRPERELIRSWPFIQSPLLRTRRTSSPSSGTSSCITVAFPTVTSYVPSHAEMVNSARVSVRIPNSQFCTIVIRIPAN